MIIQTVENKINKRITIEKNKIKYSNPNKK